MSAPRGWTVEAPPPQGRPIAPEAARVNALASWWRIVDADGSTVGYAPDEATARLFAAAERLFAAAVAAESVLRTLTGEAYAFCAADLRVGIVQARNEETPDVSR